MRKEKTLSIQKDIDKYKDIVTKEINELDPLDLFYDDGVPRNLYDNEIIEIIFIFGRCLTIEKLVEYMYIIFAYYYDIEEASPKEKFYEAAKNIFEYRKKMRKE